MRVSLHGREDDIDQTILIHVVTTHLSFIYLKLRFEVFEFMGRNILKYSLTVVL